MYDKIKTNDKKINKLVFVHGAIIKDIAKLKKRATEISKECIALCKSSQKLLELKKESVN